MRSEPIRVVVADDSLVAREMIAQILSSDAAIEVVGMAANGHQVVEMVEKLRPDLVTMDIHMPKMDGLEATERIMAFTPTPILVVSSSVRGNGMGSAFDALRLGALEVIKKPEPRDWAELESIGREVIRRVKILANVRVITHIGGRRHKLEAIDARAAGSSHPGRDIVAIGSSTGGPSALLEVLGRLPADLSVPIVVAQHIADGFVPGLVSWLDAGCDVSVKIAEAGRTLEPGTAYIAPTGRNVVVEGDALRLKPAVREQVYVPNVDTLFESVARSYGKRAVGVIMTGMGSDGAEGLRVLRNLGAATVAQDEASCTVFGMPRAAIEIDAVDRVVPLTKIASTIEELIVS
jgi:two-component system, chemotaxis family, protein-glutamate methylesterase/glutaminase